MHSFVFSKYMKDNEGYNFTNSEKSFSETALLCICAYRNRIFFLTVFYIFNKKKQTQ